MSELKTKQVEKFFNGYAYDFDSIYGDAKKRSGFDQWVDKKYRKGMRYRFEETLKRTEKKEIQTILDVGCGGGQYCHALLLQGKTVCGLDMADSMLEIAKARTIDFEGKNVISYVHNDYMSFTPEQNYDAAVFMGFFDYIEDPVAVLTKAVKETNREIYASFPIDGGLLAAQRKVRYKMRKCPLYMYSKKDLENIVEKIGMKDHAEILTLDRDFFLWIKK